MKRNFFIIFLFVSLLFAACTKAQTQNGGSMNQKSSEKNTLTLIGHASVKIKTEEGLVIYIDPFYKGDYTEPGDIILITHDHDDHNQVNLITKKQNTTIIDYKKALNGDKYNSFSIDGVKIESTEAYNKNHQKDKSVGFVITLPNNIKIYHAGDTDITEQMKNSLASQKITYAMFPCDGVYNMNPKMATEAATLVSAKYNIPIHTATGNAPIKKDIDKLFTPKGALIIPYGETIKLSN